jgi:hypothetical protein
MQASSNAVEKVQDGKSNFEVTVTLQPYDHNQHDRLEKVVKYPDNYDVDFGKPEMVQGALVIPVTISQLNQLSREERDVIAKAEAEQKAAVEAQKQADEQRVEEAKQQEEKLLDRIADRVAEKMVKSAPAPQPSGHEGATEAPASTAEMTKAPAD